MRGTRVERSLVVSAGLLIIVIGVPLSYALPGVHANVVRPTGGSAAFRVAPDGPRAIVRDTEPGVGVPGTRSASGPGPIAVQVILTLDPSNDSSLSGLLQQLSDPSSPEYHHYLSAAQYDERFGAPVAWYSALTTYLTGLGIPRPTTYADRNSIAFVATPEQVRQIFHLTLANFEDARGRGYYAPVGAPTLPSVFAAHVAGVEGLSDYSKFLIHTDLHHTTVGTAGAPLSAPGPTGTSARPLFNATPCTTAGGPFTCTKAGGRLYPAPFGNLTAASDLQVTYGTSGLYSGSGYPSKTSIATILWVNTIDNSSGSGAYCTSLSSSKYAAPFLPSDVSSFFSYTIPSKEPKPHAIGVPIRDGSGQAPPPGRSASCDSGGTSLESTLDVDMAGSLAPGANVYEVYGDGGNSGTTDLAFADILNPNSSEGTGMTAATIAGLSNVSVISNSWGYQVFNDTSWYTSLRQAQARGITVLASTPDSGDNTSNAPAGMAYDAFGDVAVGGTTIRIDPTTLLRTSEIAWYEGVGSNYGSGGGVADETNPGLGCGTGASECFPEPSWQQTSSDADGVIRTVGNGRAEPDIAAIANDTVVSLTYAGGNYTILCLATGGCPIFIFSGNSVATPVEAGVVDSIDHALQRSGLPPVGFLDPVGYSLGQGQFAGNFSKGGKLPFFDVTAYGNANFSALRGYDLVTGWGPINAQNFSAFLQHHNITFAETGLPTGTSWSVTLGGTTVHSTGTSLLFQLPYGTYAYTVQKITGFPVHPAKGTVNVRTSAQTISITY